MLNENIRNMRKSKGLSQEDLAVKLNVVRQTISKWEKGISVPDSEMLVAISEVFETPVNTLLGETVVGSEPDTLKVIAGKLELPIAINAAKPISIAVPKAINSPVFRLGLQRSRKSCPRSRISYC